MTKSERTSQPSGTVTMRNVDSVEALDVDARELGLYCESE